eukprot:CAMPEP_0194053324 /NCGR_PEP_ID=MMETSP0009_2-20130614/49289_1 /TAXON_ID=210454 /ORGANISM="Grammatophora oceanica, Strain CCMP 410" /LENGTH=57 /DNA_ID=CAMNT_0038701347 /DNA_START=1 /DNA_END=171 /DNA_ORIENTATION=-
MPTSLSTWTGIEKLVFFSTFHEDNDAINRFDAADTGTSSTVVDSLQGVPEELESNET